MSAKSDFLKSNYIFSSNFWKDGAYIIRHTSKDNYNSWEIKHDISIFDKEEILLMKYSFEETRGCIGTYSCPESNIFIYVHYKYIDSDAMLVINIYNISDSYEITQHKEYMVPLNYTCGETQGRICNAGNNLFCVVWSDLTNYEGFDSVLFDFNKCYEPQQIDKLDDTIDDFVERYYFLGTELIIEPITICENEKYINIGLINKQKGNTIVNTHVELNCMHRFSKPEEVDSTIVDMKRHNDSIYYLVRVKMENSTDVLHLEYYYLDFLIDIKINKIIEISEKIPSKNDGWFGQLSSIKITSSNPTIWNIFKN